MSTPKPGVREFNFIYFSVFLVSFLILRRLVAGKIEDKEGKWGWGGVAE